MLANPKPKNKKPGGGVLSSKPINIIRTITLHTNIQRPGIIIFARIVSLADNCRLIDIKKSPQAAVFLPEGFLAVSKNRRNDCFRETEKKHRDRRNKSEHRFVKMDAVIVIEGSNRQTMPTIPVKIINKIPITKLAVLVKNFLLSRFARRCGNE